MKKILLLLASAALLTGCGSAVAQSNDKETNEKTVYICTGRSSTRYHATKKCRGLCNCGGTIREVTIEQAERMGRTPCKICY